MSKFYHTAGDLKVAIKKDFNFIDLVNLIDPDGVLRYFVAYGCTVRNCPDIDPTLDGPDTIMGLPVQNSYFDRCSFFTANSLNNPELPTVLSEIDKQIDLLLDHRNTLTKHYASKESVK